MSNEYQSQGSTLGWYIFISTHLCLSDEMYFGRCICRWLLSPCEHMPDEWMKHRPGTRHIVEVLLSKSSRYRICPIHSVMDDNSGAGRVPERSEGFLILLPKRADQSGTCRSQWVVLFHQFYLHNLIGNCFNVL